MPNFMGNQVSQQRPNKRLRHTVNNGFFFLGFFLLLFFFFLLLRCPILLLIVSVELLNGMVHAHDCYI